MKRLLASIRAAMPDRIDVHMYAGAALIALGAAEYSRPAGMIALGITLLVFVYWRPE